MKLGRLQFAVALVALTAVTLGGCAAPPPQRRPTAMPDATIADIRSDAVEEAQRIAPVVAGPRGVATFQRVDFPLDRSTDAAWSLVDETVFPALTRGVWNANGLRVGLLPRAKVRDFVKALPRSEGVSHAQLLASEHPTPIIRTPRLKSFVTVDLTVPPGAVREEKITGGRLQLLARVSNDARAAMVVDVLPHQYIPKLTLEPRDPLLKELDGRLFNELGVRVEVPPSHLLVVGLFRPWPKPEQPEATDPGGPEPPITPDMLALQESAEATAAANAAAGVGQQNDAAQAEAGREQLPEEHASARAAEAPPLPNHLGRALFASLRSGRPIQTLLITSVQPLDSPEPRFAPMPDTAAPMTP